MDQLVEFITKRLTTIGAPKDIKLMSLSLEKQEAIFEFSVDDEHVNRGGNL
jgi:hypothetical protein